MKKIKFNEFKIKIFEELEKTYSLLTKIYRFSEEDLIFFENGFNFLKHQRENIHFHTNNISLTVLNDLRSEEYLKRIFRNYINNLQKLKKVISSNVATISDIIDDIFMYCFLKQFSDIFFSKTYMCNIVFSNDDFLIPDVKYRYFLIFQKNSNQKHECRYVSFDIQEFCMSYSLKEDEKAQIKHFLKNI